MAPATEFFDVFKAEAEAISARRAWFSHGQAGARPLLGSDLGEFAVTVKHKSLDERAQIAPRAESARNLVGLALSGGGIRSAAYCLGALQGLDAAVKDDHQPKIIDRIDYLSTVSGGGYIGSSLVAGLKQTAGCFPFASKLDQNETIETQHLRDYSNYLAPGGAIDWLVGIVVLLRGLLINAMIFGSLILAAAALTIFIHPNQISLKTTLFVGPKQPPFFWTLMLGIGFLVLQMIYAIVANWNKANPPLIRRESYGRLFAILVLLYLVVVVCELQPFILTGLFDATQLDRCPACVAQAGVLGRMLHSFHAAFPDLPSIWTLLVAAATATIAFSSKLVAVAKATLGDKRWGGFLKHWASRILLMAAAAVVPLLLWLAYLTATFWGITPTGSGLPDGYCELRAPLWLTALVEAIEPRRVLTLDGLIGTPVPAWAMRLSLIYPYGWAYALFSAVLLFVSLFVTPNASSLHGFYRDRLSRAFLWKKNELEKDIHAQTKPNWLGMFISDLLTRKIVGDVDTFKLSSLKEHPTKGADAGDAPWPMSTKDAPYLLINAAVNLEASTYLNRRGRNAGSFIFSPYFVGSEATGYTPTKDLEDLDDRLNIATAMAVSGAAASANMGASTIRSLTFSLAALNVRLGYWLPNPRLIADWKGRVPWLAKVGPIYFALETLGRLNEWAKNVYLTDGGHFDNLGVYELLKRRCKMIVVVDAEADPGMNFESLIRLERYSRIDMGVRIDLPWEELRLSSRKLTPDIPHGPNGDPTHCAGPHVAVGRICYSLEESGVIIYIKSCLSGDENDLIRDYWRRNTAFPHETTLDQFFKEEQFEVYRALGFHATQRFFVGTDQFAMLDPVANPEWTEQVKRALADLNVPGPAIAKIIARQTSGPGKP